MLPTTVPDDDGSIRLAAATSMWFSLVTFQFLREKGLRSPGTSERNLVLRPHHIVPVFQWHRVVFAIQHAYKLPIHDDVFDELIPRLQASEERFFSYSIPVETGSETDVDALEQDITQCWRKFRDRAPPGSFPFISIVLSCSAFDRSNRFHELAKRTLRRGEATDSPDASSDASHMRVLYVCARDQPFPESSRLPTTTPCLRRYLFPNDFPTRGDEDKCALTARLCRLFEYCDAHWDACGEQWLALFTDPAADHAVSSSLEEAAARFRQVHVPGPRGPFPCDVYADRRVLVLALAEARALTVGFEPFEVDCWLSMLWRALKRANRTIAKRFGTYAGVLVVATDASPEIVYSVLTPTQRFLSVLYDDA